MNDDMTMRERVVAAIGAAIEAQHNADGGDPYIGLVVDEDDGKAVAIDGVIRIDRIADAVLDAMVAPSEAMVDAGGKSIVRDGGLRLSLRPSTRKGSWGRAAAETAFRAMVRAAKKEGL